MKALMEQGVSVREVSFPDYDSDSSALVRMYLSGQFGTDPQDVNAYAASSFFAVDRFASYRKDWSRDYAKGVVIADRYTTSMLCTSAASCRGSSGKVFWIGFLILNTISWAFRSRTV